jgi:3-oxoacyl-[acyl-carrier-protein] synthase III
MKASITGIGTWLPTTVLTNDAWGPDFGKRGRKRGERIFNDIATSEDPIAAAILERELAAEAEDPFLGAKLRHVASDDQTSLDAEVSAALAALRDAGIEPSKVDLVISNTAVPDRIVPAMANGVAHRIGAHHARAFGIEVMCASAVLQLEIARGYIEAGLAEVVLLTQSHLLMRTVSLEHPASPGLGDAASALVVSRGEGLGTQGRLRTRSPERGPGLELLSTFARTDGSCAPAVTWVRAPDERGVEPPWWKAGGDYRLGSLAPEQVKALMRETVTYGATTLRDAARLAGVDLERLAVLASVQPRGFFPGAIAERVGLPRDRAVTTYARLAHVGLCGPVMNLAEARALGRLERGALIGLYAQGGGFTRSAAILKVQ